MFAKNAVELVVGCWSSWKWLSLSRKGPRYTLKSVHLTFGRLQPPLSSPKHGLPLGASERVPRGFSQFSHHQLPTSYWNFKLAVTLAKFTAFWIKWFFHFLSSLFAVRTKQTPPCCRLLLSSFKCVFEAGIELYTLQLLLIGTCFDTFVVCTVF